MTASNGSKTNGSGPIVWTTEPSRRQLFARRLCLTACGMQIEGRLFCAQPILYRLAQAKDMDKSP